MLKLLTTQLGDNVLADLLQDYISNNKNSRKCLVSKWLEGATEKECEMLNALLEDKNTNITHLFRALQPANPPFVVNTLRAHAKKACSCQRD
jgi:hypothetical protein